MEFALVAVTVISLTLACAMGVVTWRLMREERRRSDARVAALMADLHGRSVGRPEQAVPHTRDVAPLLDTAETATGLFAPMRRSPALFRRVLATVAAAVVVVAIVSLTLLPGLSGDAPADPAAGTPDPVELLSLGHARKGEFLAITGSLRNPAGGIEQEHLSVTAIVFDRDGAVVGTGQTPLPVAVLAPGSETPFTISLPDADRINRYRISFMRGQTSVPHVDRRRLHDPARAAVRGEDSLRAAPAPTGDQS